ncbi:hypothetical protein EON80_03175 [bacterium]|nr:MAG: hypothetical protein EON80_03175 [bacterium]
MVIWLEMFSLMGIGGFMVSAILAALSSLRLSVVAGRLLAALSHVAPDVYERLYNPIWRHNYNPFHLAAFLRSAELDDVAVIAPIKNDGRRIWRWLTWGVKGAAVWLVVTQIFGGLTALLND